MKDGSGHNDSRGTLSGREISKGSGSGFYGGRGSGSGLYMTPKGNADGGGNLVGKGLGDGRSYGNGYPEVAESIEGRGDG